MHADKPLQRIGFLLRCSRLAKIQLSRDGGRPVLPLTQRHNDAWERMNKFRRVSLRCIVLISCSYFNVVDCFCLCFELGFVEIYVGEKVCWLAIRDDAEPSFSEAAPQGHADIVIPFFESFKDDIYVNVSFITIGLTPISCSVAFVRENVRKNKLEKLRL